MAAGAWAVTGGDDTISQPIFESAFYGDYVVTPDVLRGERSLEFVGRPSEPVGGRPVATPNSSDELPWQQGGKEPASDGF